MIYRDTCLSGRGGLGEDALGYVSQNTGVKCLLASLSSTGTVYSGKLVGH
jgi:hypothetical protein